MAQNCIREPCSFRHPKSNPVDKKVMTTELPQKYTADGKTVLCISKNSCCKRVWLVLGSKRSKLLGRSNSCSPPPRPSASLPHCTSLYMGGYGMRRVFSFLRPRTQAHSSESGDEEPFGGSASGLCDNRQVTVSKFSNRQEDNFEKTIFKHPALPYHGYRSAPNGGPGEGNCSDL